MDFSLKIYPDVAPILDDEGDWERLLHQSQHDTLFMTPGWLRATWLCYGEGAEVWIPVVYQGQEPVAAGAFLSRRGILAFLGGQMADYADILLSQTLTPEQAQICLELIIHGVQQATRVKAFCLKHILAKYQTPQRLQACNPPLYVTVLQQQVAAAMSMERAPQVLNKQHLRQRERKLMLQGELRCETFDRTEAILSRLDHLFALHQRRWDGTSTPSLFNQPVNQQLYLSITKTLAPRGYLRYTEVYLNDQLIAAHFGGHYQGVFSVYTVCFDPQWAMYSPGIVLLQCLIRQASEEQAQWFDFTLGAESYKARFATRFENVVDLHVTTSRFRHYWLQAHIYTRQQLRNLLLPLGIWPYLQAIKRKWQHWVD